VAALDGKLRAAAAHLAAAHDDLLAFTAVPREIRRQIWNSNTQKLLNPELRRQNDVVGIFPDRVAIVRLVESACAPSESRTPNPRIKRGWGRAQ
jgi:putative transposase